jgi:hypothetical protein
MHELDACTLAIHIQMEAIADEDGWLQVESFNASLR